MSLNEVLKTLPNYQKILNMSLTEEAHHHKPVKYLYDETFDPEQSPLLEEPN